jgi:hypothetical protein
MLAAVLIGVVLPGVWLWRQPVLAVSAKPLLVRQLGVALLAFLVAVGLFWMSFQDIASLTRNHKQLRYMINPFNSVYALTRLAVGQATQAVKPLQVIGEDASLRMPPASEATEATRTAASPPSSISEIAPASNRSRVPDGSVLIVERLGQFCLEICHKSFTHFVHCAFVVRYYPD